MTKKPSKPLCKAPFMAVRVSPEGYINPCCWMKSTSFPTLKTTNTSIQEYWNSKQIKKLRKQMFEDTLPKTCSRCYDSKNDIDYQRIKFYDDVMKDVKQGLWVINQPMVIRQMDINFSNKCNLKCRHCGPWNSTSWLKDYKKLDKKLNLYGDNYKVNLGNTSFIHDKEIFSNVVKINFKGGEPMMQDEMYTLLENLVNWDFAKNIELIYITNGTKPSEHLHKLWKQFKEVYVSFSFEATGDLFEYVRGGTALTWGNFNDNIKMYTNLDCITRINFAHTLMNFTLFNLPNQIEWLYDMKQKYNIQYDNVISWKNTVSNPPYLAITVLPKDLKRKLIEQYSNSKYDSLKTLTNTLKKSLYKQNTRYWNQFVLYTNSLDKIRNESLTSVVPEFKDYI